MHRMEDVRKRMTQMKGKTGLLSVSNTGTVGYTELYTG